MSNNSNGAESANVEHSNVAVAQEAGQDIRQDEGATTQDDLMALHADRFGTDFLENIDWSLSVGDNEAYSSQNAIIKARRSEQKMKGRAGHKEPVLDEEGQPVFVNRIVGKNFNHRFDEQDFLEWAQSNFAQVFVGGLIYPMVAAAEKAGNPVPEDSIITQFHVEQYYNTPYINALELTATKSFAPPRGKVSAATMLAASCTIPEGDASPENMFNLVASGFSDLQPSDIAKVINKIEIRRLGTFIKGGCGPIRKKYPDADLIGVAIGILDQNSESATSKSAKIEEILIQLEKGVELPYDEDTIESLRAALPLLRDKIGRYGFVACAMRSAQKQAKIEETKAKAEAKRAQESQQASISSILEGDSSVADLVDTLI